MQKRITNSFAFFLLAISSVTAQQPAVTKIAFGSCGHQNDPQPVLSLAADQKPDAFIFLGDNIYGDTDDMKVLQAKYAKLGAKAEYKKLASSTKILATWDDHDYGRNDAGKEYPFAAESKELFLQFFNEPANSERRKHKGIYHTEYIKTGGKTVQVILLDNRSFRNGVLQYDTSARLPRKKYFYKLDYQPHTTADSTLLGAEQWAWLEGELQKPADLRLICSGSQFGIEFNGYEAWANFPHEQKRMLELIKKTKANGVIFLTGDVHYAEISKLEEEALYPIYDVTSSGITSTWDFATANSNRIEGPVMENNFGLLTITWEKDPVIKMQIIDKKNNSRIEYTIQKSEIEFQR
ncbi:MAG TPA: alkaline phosphatase D family protein [Flavisolibacter sp.]|nr:alkaline phosphatase D family protein [Flavisolibacter sp.]